MQALVLTTDGVAVSDDTPEPRLGDADVEVAMRGVGVCGTDLALVRGDRSVPERPWIIGHEGVGTVSRLGSAVTSLKVGDLVALEPNVVDLTCAACVAGHTSRCEHRTSAGISTPGYLADRAVVPAEFAWKLPDDIALEDAVCIEPMSVAVAAVRRSELPDDARVLVLGAGAQGLLTVLALRARNLTPAVTDLQDDRVDLAMSLGATELGDQHLFTHVIDTTGSPAALHAVLGRLAGGAHITVVGESPKPLQLSTQDIVQQELTIRGSFIYDHPIDFRTTIDLITSGAARPRDIVRHRASLADAATAIQQSPERVGKTWIAIGASEGASR